MSIPKGWEEVRLGDIISIKSEKYTPNKNEVKKCIELEHLEQNTGILLEYTNSNLQKSTKNVFKKGQVLFGKLRPYLKKYYLAEFDGVCSSEIWVMSGNNVLNNFLFYLVQSDDFMNAANISCGTKMPRADWKYMQEITIKLPPLKEQEKIAEILSSCDEHIKNLKNLKSELEKEKLHLMNELLSGKTRFANFTTPWQEVALKDIFDFLKGQGLSKGKITPNGANECILYGELYTTYKERINCIVSKTDANEGIKSINGDILIPASTTTTGIDLAIASSLNKDNVLLGGDINILRKKIDLHSDYAALYIRYMLKNQIASYAQGTTIIHLYANKFSHLKIKLPSLEEQKKIGEVLSACDERLECLNELITAQTTLKSHLLTELLTGNIRVF